MPPNGRSERSLSLIATSMVKMLSKHPKGATPESVAKALGCTKRRIYDVVHVCSALREPMITMPKKRLVMLHRSEADELRTLQLEEEKLDRLIALRTDEALLRTTDPSTKVVLLEVPRGTKVEAEGAVQSSTRGGFRIASSGGRVRLKVIAPEGKRINVRVLRGQPTPRSSAS